jgi:hypothetical protein
VAGVAKDGGVRGEAKAKKKKDKSQTSTEKYHHQLISTHQLPRKDTYVFVDPELKIALGHNRQTMQSTIVNLTPQHAFAPGFLLSK